MFSFKSFLFLFSSPIRTSCYTTASANGIFYWAMKMKYDANWISQWSSSSPRCHFQIFHHNMTTILSNRRSAGMPRLNITVAFMRRGRYICKYGVSLWNLQGFLVDIWLLWISKIDRNRSILLCSKFEVQIDPVGVTIFFLPMFWPPPNPPTPLCYIHHLFHVRSISS